MRRAGRSTDLKRIKAEGLKTGKDHKMNEDNVNTPAGVSPEDAGAQHPEGKNSAQSQEVNFTPEQQAKIDKLISQTVAKERKRAEESLAEAEKLRKMNADQKAEYEREKLTKERDEALAKVAHYEMGQEASKMLGEEGISADTDTLAFVVKETAEETKAAVKAYVKLVNAKAEELMRQKLSGSAPKVNVAPNVGVTKESIMGIKDPKERFAQIQQNPTLFGQ